MYAEQKPIEQFGKYELLHRVGVGGMAEVFVARTYGAQGFVKHVVIKRILPAFSQDEDFVHMFIDEARLAAKLQHANIVQIFDFDHVDGAYYIAMEWVDGVDLRAVGRHAQRRALPLPQTLAVHVGVETLKGLHYAHSRREGGRPMGLVHRDISPHNLLLSFSGEVKVTDFGIAKAAALASATRSGMVKGKLAYMSPEQVRGESVDHRTDIYALGIVLWEVLAQRRLYQDVGSEGELMVRVRQGRVPDIAQVVPGLPTGLAAVIGRMLATDPNARYASADAALADLSAFAGVRDALEVEDYLRRLLPPEAQREGRGETAAIVQPVPVVPGFREASPMADTRTRDAGAGEQSFSGPSEISATADSPRRGLALWIVWGLLLLAGSALAAWQLAPTEDWSVGTAVPLVVESEPVGAKLTVDGVPLAGATPTTLWSRPGRRLEIQASRGTQTRREPVHISNSLKTFRFLLSTQVAGAAPSAAPSASRPATSVPDGADAERATAVAERARSKSSRRRVARRRSRRRRPTVASRSPKPEARSAVGQGSVRVVVEPWANVTIDGKSAGMTPVYRAIAAGTHKILLHNQELGRRETLSVTIQPGRTRQVRRIWR